MKALLIIDVQTGLCVGKYKAVEVEGLIEPINSVSAWARATPGVQLRRAAEIHSRR